MFAALSFALVLAVLAVVNANANASLLQSKSIHNLRLAGNATVTSYLVMRLFPEKETCSGNPITSIGYGMGACIVNSDDPVSPQSSIYAFVKGDASSTVYSINSYADLNCAGTPTTTTLTLPNACVPSAGVQYSYSTEGKPWEAAKDSVASYVWSDANCHANPGLWQTSAYTNCFQDGTGADGEAVQYSRYTACHPRVSIDHFSDAACTVRTESNTNPPLICKPWGKPEGSYVTLGCSSL